MCTHFQARPTSEDKAFEFKKIIVKCGENACKAFFGALMATNQEHIAEELAHEFVTQWYVYIANQFMGIFFL